MRLNVRFPLAVTLILLTASVFAGAQSTYNSSGVIFLTGSLYDSVGSSISVTNLPGTVTDISVTLNGLDITELNSVAMALVPPSGSGLKALDFFSGICGVGTQQIITNVFTVADTGAMGTDNVSGMIPYLGGTCPNALVGTYLPSDYFPGQDTFHSPGPSTYNSGGIGSTACASLNVNCGSYTFSTAFGLPASPTSLDGTWTLYIASQASGEFTPAGTLASWSITFTTETAAATTTSISTNNNGETSTVFTNGNVGGQSEQGTQVAFTATVQSNGSPVAAGTVTFYDSTFSSPGIALSLPVAVNGSGQASVVITFPPSEEGNRNITAAYSGVSGTYAASSTAAGINELTVNHPYNPSGATFCNGPVYINDNLGLAGGTGGYPYASQLVLGSSFSQLQGTIENVTVSLNGLQSEQPDFNGFLLVSPAGQAFEFMSWADGIGPGGTPSGLTDLNLILSDTGSGSLQTSTDDQVDCSSTPCKAADDYSQISPLYNDTFPSPAPSNIGKAYPTGSATFTSQFGGAGANGTWLLYLNNWLAEDPSSNSSLPYGEVGSWCLNFTMQANAHPTTTSASGSPNPASFSSPATTASVNLTANVSVTDASGLTVSAGTVSFVDGATTLGSSPVSNGQATLSASLGEGTHQIVATYSGTNTGTEFGISTSTFDLRVDTATTNPASGAGTYKYCNTGSITAPGLGLDSGPAAPYPSNIFVTNLPGTVNAVTVTLNGFSTRDQGDLLALLVGPGGNNLDFFSLTGSDVSSAPAPINLTFSDSGSGIGGNLSSSGTYRPTSFNTNIAYPQCPPNANLCGSENVGPPLASNPFTPTNKAATAGTSVLGNASEAGVFGGTTASTYNGNGTWSLYLDDGGPTGGGELTNVTNGWCLNLTENLPVLAISKSHTGDFAQGQTGAQYSVVVTNDGPGPTAGTVTVTENPPTGLTVTGMSGNNWNCSTSSCTRSDGLAQSNRYDTITVTVNVSSNAASSVTNSVSVSGGGTISTVTANDQTTINPAPLLGITKSPNGTFTQGQTGEWILTVFNTVAGSATNGVVTVTDTLPTNYIVENISGTGWGCVGAGTGSASCTSEQVVAGGSSFSPIVLMVNIPANSPTSVTNNASTYGGGDLYHTNASNAATAFSTVNVAQSQFVLTTAANPSNGGTVSPTSGGSYNSGTVVPIVASPAAGYAFVNWTSSPGSVASSTSASTTITMNAAESVTANFTVALTYTPSLNFDTVYTNSTHKLTGTITNNSATNVTFTGATITLGTANLGAYKPLLYCTGTPLKPGKSCTFAVDFAPGSQTGTLTATMNILDSAGTQEVSLTGNVIDPVVEFINPTTQSVMKTLAFGPVAVNGSLTLPVQLTNSGQTDLDISNVTITGLNAGEYSANNLCPASLTPTNSCTIEVTFAPTVKGAAGATLVVTDNVVAGKSSIPITGNGHEK